MSLGHGASADTVTGLEHKWLDAGVGELERSREAGELRAHDGDTDALALSEFCAQPSYVAARVMATVVMAVGGVVFSRSGT